MQEAMRACVKVGAVSMEMPMINADTTALHVQGPSSTEVVFAITKESFATAMECLPSLEMADAPPVDVAVCMATPVVPDEGGHGEEIRQRAASLGQRVETELRLRYVEEITSRAAVRAGDVRRRKRSLDDLDVDEVNKELLPKTANEEEAGPLKKEVPKQKENNGKKSNVTPFKSSPGQNNVSPFRPVAKLSGK